KRFSRPAGRVIESPIRVVITHKERPSEKSGFPRLVYFVVAPWTPRSQAIVICIGPHFSPIEVSGFLVDGNPIRVTVTHYINLRLGFIRTFGEKIAFGDFITAIRQYFY